MEVPTAEKTAAAVVGVGAIYCFAPSIPWAVVCIFAFVAFGAVASAGLNQTIAFLLSLSKNKNQKQTTIDNYNQQHDSASANQRNAEYAQLVNSYYDLATEFYEWGWGTSFHFADRRQGETFKQSILRHEYYVAGRLGVTTGTTLLDCGCGIGGPARNIARFTGANVKAITINQFQVNRGNAISSKEGMRPQVELIQGDFMKLPFADASFDGVYAIESTCHAPDRAGVYSEILRVLKPGGYFACYEWCLTDKYVAESEEHKRLKKEIEVGDGLPDLVHTSVCTKALVDAGFDVKEARDCQHDGHLDGGEAWYVPLTPSWCPWKWPRFQFNPVMWNGMPLILQAFEFIGLVPKGTAETQVMLQQGAVGLVGGGELDIFTPMWLMVGQKPLQ